MSHWKAIGISPFVAFAGMIVWMICLSFFGDPRVSDGSLTGAEMSWLEMAASVYALIGVIIAWLVAVGRALAANRYGWAAGVFIFWPLAAYYNWREAAAKKEPIQPPETTREK